MSILILKLFGLLCIYQIIMLPILTILVSNIFQKKSKNLLTNLQSKDLLSQQIFLESKHMIQWCVDIISIGFIDFMLIGKSLRGFTKWWYNFKLF